MKPNYLSVLTFSLFFILIFSSATTSIFRKNYAAIEKDTLNVLAPKGIWLRNNASLESEKLVKLPYATKLILLEEDITTEEITIQETKYFEIKGRMRKVKVSSQDKVIHNLEGYVFEGYLTKFPVPELNYKPTEDNYISADLYYFENSFGTSEKIIKKCPIYSEGEPPCQHTFEQKFGNVIVYKSTCEESGGSESFTFKGLSLREAYFIFYVLYFDEAVEETTENEAGTYYYGYEGDVILYEKDKNQVRIEPKDGGAGCYYEIKQKENDILVSSYCGC